MCLQMKLPAKGQHLCRDLFFDPQKLTDTGNDDK